MRTGHKLPPVRIFYIMNICQLKRGESAFVMRVDVEAPLKERLRSLNVYPNSKITLLKVSPFKKTYLLQAGSAVVAMRREIASGIRVFRT